MFQVKQFLYSGPDPDRVLQDNMVSMCAVLEEQKHKKQAAPVPISGPELAAMMKIGTRVMRGVDWKWGDQVTSLYRSKVRVQLEKKSLIVMLWNEGYRMDL